jgi:serine/threonine protein kinase
MAPCNTEPIPLHEGVTSRQLNWRQQSLVRRAVSFVQDDLQHVLSFSPFLRSPPHHNQSALLHRTEIQTGQLLGYGGFSEVHEIVGFALNPSVSHQLTPFQQRARLLLQRQCIDPVTGRGRYAIKHLQTRLLEKNSDEFAHAASDLAVEAQYLGAIEHPHILSVRGLPIEGIHALADGKHDAFFIVTDRLEDTLDRRVQSWQTRDADVLYKAELALQLASALEYLHERRIVFRDLKPQNIGFTSDGTLKLFDFGLCRELPSPDLTCFADVYEVFSMSGVGTRRYMAPEVANEGKYNCKADVYGWSMVVWEMLNTSKPYPTYSLEDHKQRVCIEGERPPINRSWPLQLQGLLTQAWTPLLPERLTSREVCGMLHGTINSIKLSLLLDSPESPIAVAESAWAIDHTSTAITSMSSSWGLAKASCSPDSIRLSLPPDLLNASYSSDTCSLLDRSLMALTVSSSSSMEGFEVTSTAEPYQHHQFPSQDETYWGRNKLVQYHF